MWRSTGRVGIWRFPLCLPEGGGPLPGPALKGKPSCSGPGQGTGQHTSSTRLMPIWGHTDVCPGMGEQGHRKPGPLSGPLGYLQGSGGAQARDPATGANWTCLCILATPASLHLLEGGSLEAEPGWGRGRTRWGSLPPSPSQFRVPARQMQGLPSPSPQPCCPEWSYS